MLYSLISIGRSLDGSGHPCTTTIGIPQLSQRRVASKPGIAVDLVCAVFCWGCLVKHKEHGMIKLGVSIPIQKGVDCQKDVTGEGPFGAKIQHS